MSEAIGHEGIDISTPTEIKEILNPVEGTKHRLKFIRSQLYVIVSEGRHDQVDWLTNQQQILTENAGNIPESDSKLKIDALKFCGQIELTRSILRVNLGVKKPFFDRGYYEGRMSTTDILIKNMSESLREINIKHGIEEPDRGHPLRK